jgi:hypothetical protein
MRIYGRAAFMQLPEGVIFAKGQPWFWGDLCVKGETLHDDDGPIDFAYRNLIGIESHDTGELVERFEAMLQQAVSFPMEDAYGRDGCFDKDDLFLVWERADLEEMMRVMGAALAMEQVMALPAAPKQER